MRNKGFSLIELMVTVAIAGIVAVTAVPSFNTTIERNRIISERDELAGHLRLARSTAVASNGTVVVCASSDKNSCNKTGDWEAGWIVFIKSGSDVSTYSSSSDQLLKVSEGIDDINTLTWDGGGSEIAFDGDGNARSSGTFTFCGSSASDNLAKALILYKTGSMRPGIDNNSNGISEDMGGSDLSC